MAAKEIGVYGIQTDVTKEKDVVLLAKHVIARFGRIDIWINNAGIWLPHGPIEEASMSRAHDLFEVNFFGTVYGARAALSYMKKAGSGSIVNIITTSALEGRPFSSMYSSSKWAVRGFSEALKGELVGTKLRVINVYPGGMKTHFFDEHKPEQYDSYMAPEFVAQKIVENLERALPHEELILKRPVSK